MENKLPQPESMNNHLWCWRQNVLQTSNCKLRGW